MGLFVNRPEEPSEWAGLPSEPLDPQSAAERLGAPVSLDLGGLFGEGTGSVESIAISIAPTGLADAGAHVPDEG